MNVNREVYTEEFSLIFAGPANNNISLEVRDE